MGHYQPWKEGRKKKAVEKRRKSFEIISDSWEEIPENVAPVFTVFSSNNASNKRKRLSKGKMGTGNLIWIVGEMNIFDKKLVAT